MPANSVRFMLDVFGRMGEGGYYLFSSKKNPKHLVIKWLVLVVKQKILTEVVIIINMPTKKLKRHSAFGSFVHSSLLSSIMLFL